MPSKLLAAILLCACSAVSAGINTWTAIGPTGGRIYRIVFGTAAHTVFATTEGGFYRSQDDGSTWTPIKSDFLNAPTGMAVDPSDSSRIYVVAPDWPSLYASTDGGTTLAPVTTLPTAVTQARQVVVSQDGRTIFVSSGARVFRSVDRGLTWTERSSISADPFGIVWHMEIDPTDANRIYVGASLSTNVYALLRTQDGGQSWEVLLSGSSAASVVTDIAVTASNPLQIWVATQGGLLRSTDRGASWTNVYSGGVFAVGLNPADPLDAYASVGSNSVYRSVDAGVQWTDITHGQDAGHLSAIAVNPAQGARVLLGGDGGLYGSSNSGANWTAQQSGIVASSISSISSDTTSGRIYLNASAGGIHYTTSASASTLPVDNAALKQLLQTAPQSLGITAMLAQPGRLLASLITGLGRSVDGGNTWARVQVAPTGTQQIFSLASTNSDPQTVLAAGATRLFRSTDGGLLWTQISAGIPANVSFGPVLVAPSDGHFAYTDLYSTAALGNYRSTDGGLSWTAASGNPAADPRLLAVDPVVATTLYGSTEMGFFKSVNGGATWASLPWIQQEWKGSIQSIAVDPRRTQTLYAASGSRIARSIDGGTTWETLRDISVMPLWLSPLLFSDSGSAGTLLVGTGAFGVQKITIAPDLVLSGTSPAVPTGLGVPLVFRLPFANQGPFDATGVRVNVQWPASATNVTVVSSSGACTVVTNTAACLVEPFRNGSTAVLTLTATPAAAGNFLVQGSIAGDQSDANQVNNAIALQANVAARADLSVTATGTTTTQTGGSIVHTVTVMNAGPNSASAPMLNVQLGSGLMPATATSPQGSCTVNTASALVTCTLADLASGSSAAVTVTSSAAVAGTWGSTAQVTSTTADGSATDNSSIATTIVSQAPAPPPGSGGSGGGGSSGGSSGGGGALSFWEVLSLLAIGGWLQRKRPCRVYAVTLG